MNTATNTRIEVFRATVERLSTITGQLQSLAITIARADELPGLIQRSSNDMEARWLREEQTAIGHPMSLRILRSQLENELRQVHSVIGEHLRAALDAATKLVTEAAGEADAVMSPFARRHLEELARYRKLPPLSNTRLAFLRSAWMAIDAAMATLHGIRFGARRRNLPFGA
jgi:hypothetical protein